MAGPDRSMNLMDVEVPLAEGSGLALMAECFAEEFARMGYSGEALLALFRNPFYQGPHAAWQHFGEAWVRDLIQRQTEEG